MKEVQLDQLTSQRLQLAAALAQDVQHGYNNALSTSYGYVELLARQADVSERLFEVLDNGGKLVSGYFYLIREIGKPVRTLLVDDLMEEVVALLGAIRLDLVQYEPSGLQLSDANKHVLFYLITQIGYTLSNGGESGVVVTISRDRPAGGDTGDALNIEISCERTLEDERAAVLSGQVELACQEVGYRWTQQGHRWQLIVGGASNADLSETRVLVALEDPQAAEIVRPTLAQYGHDVVEVESVVVAMSVFEENPELFDAVILCPAGASTSLRATLLRMKAIYPGIKTMLVTAAVVQNTPAEFVAGYAEIGRVIAELNKSLKA